MKKINSFTKICFLITSIFLFSCKQPANPAEESPVPSTISPEQVDANIKKSGIAKNVELPTTIQNVSYKLILSASSGTFNASKNERAANNSCSGSFFYKDSYVFINIEDDSSFLKIFVDKVLDEMNRQAVKAKSEIENSTLIISSTKPSTSITSDDYTNAKTSFTEKVEDYLTGLTEEEPPAENPTDENSITEDPTVETPTIKVQDMGIYKTLNSLGFDVTTEKVEAIDGQYQPKTGDITSLSYRQVNTNTKYTYTYTLDRENSTEDNLVYKGSCLNERWNETEEYDRNTITVNKEEKSIDINDSNINKHCKFVLNEDGTLTFLRTGVESPEIFIIENDNSIYGVSGKKLFSDINIKLAE